MNTLADLVTKGTFSWITAPLVVLILGGVALLVYSLAYRSAWLSNRASRLYRQWSAAGTLGLGVLVFGFTSVGLHMREGRPITGFFDFFVATYETAQVYFLNTSTESGAEPAPAASAGETTVDGAKKDGQTLRDAGRENAAAENSARGGGTKPRVNWALGTGMFLAALFVVVVAAQAICTMFHESCQQYRLSKMRGHVVVCGLGRIGRQLIETLTARETSLGQARWFVAIEPDPENRNVAWAREHGVIVIVGDSKRREVLEEAQVSRAAEVFVVAGEDEANIEALIEIRDVITHPGPRAGRWGRGPSPTIECHVHILNRDLAAIMREETHEMENRKANVVEDGQGRKSRLIRFHVFNALERTARRLLEDLSCGSHGGPPLRPRTEQQVGHFVMLGFGDFGQTLALQLAELAHFENLKRLRMTIIDEQIDDKGRRFLSRYPSFAPEFGTCGPWMFEPKSDRWESRDLRPATSVRTDDEKGVEYVCNAGFAELPPDITDPKLVDPLWRLAAEKNVVPVILVCFADDGHNFALARRLQEALRRKGVDLPIFVWIPRQRELSQLLIERRVEAAKAGAGRLHELAPFGECYGSVSYEEVTGSWTRWLSRWIHMAWNQLFADWKGRKPEWTRLLHEMALAAIPDWSPLPAEQIRRINGLIEKLDVFATELWEAEPELMRASNRSSAAHAVVKLAMLDPPLRITGLAPECEPTEARIAPGNDKGLRRRIETMLEIEHNRWMSERLLNGWRFEPEPNAESESDAHSRLESKPGDNPEPKCASKPAPEPGSEPTPRPRRKLTQAERAKRNLRRVHHLIVPWEHVGEDYRKNDEIIVRLLIGLCRIGKLLTEPVDSPPES